MKKAIMSLAVLLLFITLAYGRDEIAMADLESGILIDVFSGAAMQLKNGECERLADTNAAIDEGDYSYKLGLGNAVWGPNGKSVALPVIESFVGGNGCRYRIGYATKQNGRTYIRMGDSFAMKWALIVAVQFSKTINVAMYEFEDDLWKGEAPVIKVFEIINNVPVLSKKP